MVEDPNALDDCRKVIDGDALCDFQKLLMALRAWESEGQLIASGSG